MYAKGMSQRDIASTIEDIYGFEISHETISEITNNVIECIEQLQNRPLKKFYPFLFVYCLYVNIYKDYEVKNCAIYTILGYDIDGMKEILGFWINETESTYVCMQIFYEIKSHGVEDILFISMDGVKVLEEDSKSIFKYAIESVNSSLRKMTRKGSFPNENTVLKLLYLRVTELENKWSHRPISN